MGELINIIESPAKQYMMTPDDKQKVYDRVMADVESTNNFFDEKIELRNRNYDYYAGRQWSTEETAAIEKQFRRAYVFNEIHHKVEHLVGTQTQTRLDSRMLPRERGDEAEAELLNFLTKSVEQLNDIEMIETEVFRDGLVGAVGCSIVRWESQDIQYGYPKVEVVPVDEMRWDITAKKMDMSDARWMARVTTMTRYDALELYPEKAELIKRAPVVSGSTSANLISKVLSDHQDKVFTSHVGSSATEDRDLIQVIEYIERSKIYQYIVADEISGTVNKFDAQNDAQEFYHGKIDEYTEQGEILINPDASPRIAIVTVTKDMYTLVIIIGDEVAYYIPTDLPNFPWQLYFSYFNKGDYWAYVDVLIDPQVLVNRFFSQWDHQLGSSTKNAMTVVEAMLAKGWNIEDIRREASKTGPIFPVKDHSAIAHLPNPPITPELFQGINFSLNRMADYTGGRNVMGLQENAAESGRAVIARAEQGGVARLPLFDRLRIWRKQVTQMMVWYIKNYMTSGQVLRFIGADEDVQFLELDTGILDTLKEIEVDIHIDEAVKSETAKQQNFQQLKELFSVVSLPPEVIIPIMIEYSSIPQSKKREILQMLEFYQGYIKEKAQMQKEQKLTQEVVDSLKKREIKDQMLRQEELDNANTELDKQRKDAKTKLEDIEEIRMQMQDQAQSPQTKNSLFNKLNTPEEIRARQTATIESSML